MQGETENREMPGHIGGFLKEAPNQQGTDDYNSIFPCGYCVENALYGENGGCPAEMVGGRKKVISNFCRNGMASVMPFPVSLVRPRG